jgi:type VI secretion system secreted protein Hcp
MKKVCCAVLIFQALLFSTNAFSQGIYLRAQAAGFDFNGGVTAVGYQNQVELFSFSDGISGCAVVGTKACVSTSAGFNLMTKLTRAVIDFRSVQLQNKIITSVDVAWVRVNGEGVFESYKIHMEDVRITSVQESGSSGGDDAPTVSVSLQPARVAWKVTTLTAAGTPGPSSVYGWDFKANAAFTYSFPAL